jgi:hypothetical protein
VAEHDLGRRAWQSKVAQLMGSRKHTEQEMTRDKINPSRKYQKNTSSKYAYFLHSTTYH